MLVKKNRRRAQAALLAATVWSGAGASGLGGGAAWGDAPPPPPSRDEIRCVGAVCSVSVCLTQRLLADPFAVGFGSLRIVPHQVDGKVHGLRLFGMRPDSLPAQLGLQNGDIVLSVNGYALDGPDSALSAYSQLTGATELTLALERAGQSLTRKLQFERRPPAAGECPPPPPPPPPPAAPPPAASAPPAAAPTLRSLARDISCKGSRCVLANGVVDRVLGNSQLLLGSARVVPVIKDGKALGVKLAAVRPGSLWALLGLKNGDVVRTIDQYNLGQPDEALLAYVALRKATEVHVTLDRAGAPLTMTYVIQH